jgi:hypothetical protein
VERGWARLTRQVCGEGCSHPLLEVLAEAVRPKPCQEHPGDPHLHLTIHPSRRYRDGGRGMAIGIGTVEIAHGGLLDWLTEASEVGGLLTLRGADGTLNGEISHESSNAALRTCQSGRIAETLLELRD